MQSCLSLLSLAHMASDRVLMKSRMHCHARNVSSIVLRSRGGRLTRAFLAWPGHTLSENRPGCQMTVGIHDHRYDLSLSLVFGDVQNVMYEHDEASGVRLKRWRFRSGVENGAPVATPDGEGWMAESSREQVLPSYSQKLRLNAFSLHTIECVGVCGWYVEEGVERQQETVLFTEGDAVDATGLYVPFASRREVLDHVTQWCMEVIK